MVGELGAARVEVAGGLVGFGLRCHRAYAFCGFLWQYYCRDGHRCGGFEGRAASHPVQTVLKSILI